MRPRRRDATSDQEIVELAALADGSLAPERRAELEARVAASSELAALLAEQERAVSFARSAAAEVEAPETLRLRIPTGERARHGPVRHRLVLISAATATAVLAVGIGLAVFNSSSGWRIELDATGLPRLDRGRFYEAWLRNAAGVLVPIGTFNEGRNVTLWAGVSPKAFGTLTVTREQADGDQASSGEKVLAGTVRTGG
jgi:anti-sigma factor RsiW